MYLLKEFQARWLVALTIGLMIPVACGARICPPARTEKNESLQYLTNLVDSYSWTKEALNTFTDHRIAPDASVDDVLDASSKFMLELNRAAEDYECAATLVEPYLESKNRWTVLSARLSGGAYRKLSALCREYAERVKDTLNGKDIKLGDKAEWKTNFQIEVDKANEQLGWGTSDATWAILVVPKEGERFSTLNMTLAQKRAVDEGFQKVFGDELSKETKDLETAVDQFGRLLYDFINRPEWKCVDSE